MKKNIGILGATGLVGSSVLSALQGNIQMNQKKIYLDLKCLFGVEKNYHICYITLKKVRTG